MPVTNAAATTWVTGQASPTTIRTRIAVARTKSRRITLLNYGSVTCYIGTDNVSTTLGIALDPQNSIDLEVQQAIYGITASGTATIHWSEVYG